MDVPESLSVIGWREWVGLPDMGIRAIKAKVDTGAASSSLHAFDVESFRKEDEDWVRFQVHPIQRNDEKIIEVESKVLEYRSVRSSSGKATTRPVIVTHVALMGMVWPVELTLADRSLMGFRMLLGREGMRRRFLVDSAKSFCGGRPKKRKKRKLKHPKVRKDAADRRSLDTDS